MAIPTACPLCREIYLVADQQLGKLVHCKRCGNVLLVDGATGQAGNENGIAFEAAEKRVQTEPQCNSTSISNAHDIP
jgi:predicted Zn finger-like uncharacterized protein